MPRREREDLGQCRGCRDELAYTVCSDCSREFCDGCLSDDGVCAECELEAEEADAE